jgi:signal transduction histidine kinase
MSLGLATRETLAKAFADFNRAAGILQFSYHELQQEIAALRQQVEEKNRHLAQSLGENERIRLRLQNLLDTLPCGVAVLKKDGSLQVCNPEAKRLLAASESHSRLQAALAEPGPQPERELALASDNQPLYVAVRPATLAAESGEPETLLIMRDVTADHCLEEERQSARRFQALAESSALLAHEVRNPLASMELFASLLVDAGASGHSEVGNWAKHIQAGVRLIAATVNNVLHLRNAGPLQLRTVDLVDLLGSTVELLEPVAHQAGVRIEFCSHAEKLMVQADRSRLQQVFFNLAVNAFRAMQPGGVLAVETLAAENAVEVRFRDQGCGIAPEDLDRVFEPGFSRVPGSSGFGLAVCRKIMDQHNGGIHIASRVGTGTTISLTFVPKGETA